MPAGVTAAAVAQAGDVAHEDLVGAEAVPIRASRRRARDPPPGRGLYQLAQHDYKPIPLKRAKLGPATCRIIGQRPSGGGPAG